MSELENKKNDSTESSKKKRVKKTTAKPVTQAKPVDGKDHMILNDAKNGVQMNLICARYMVHRTYVEQLVEKYG